MSVIGKRIKEARDCLGVSQMTYGELAGLTRRDANVYMNRYENGSVIPKYNLVLKLAEAAGLPEYFFYIQDDAVAESLLDAVSGRGSWTVDLSGFSPKPNECS